MLKPKFDGVIGPIFLFSSVVIFLSACGSPDSAPHNLQDREAEIRALPGFQVELLYTASRDSQGTWVSLLAGPDGDLLVSSQGNEGLYRISIGRADNKPDVQVVKLKMPMGGAHGLTLASGSLYANVNGRGLVEFSGDPFRDEFSPDKIKELGGPAESGEHGNHGVITAPTEETLFIINGNYTPLPDTFSKSLSGWEEDILLPRMWDVRGNARGIMAPGGYIAALNLESTDWKLLSVGYRNIYDAAVSPEGELFTVDSDMEFDMGMPWYRPTRLIHAVSGSDYGWRSGSGKWKSYYEDTLPPVLEVGPGSPTGLLFGTGARFPARYQRALFGLDWTYGTIYAFHLRPVGSSYRADAEEFLSGNPLPVTDAVIGEDGAMYFITGGRSNESRLYRVTYTGEQPTDRADSISDSESGRSRETRRELETFHGREVPGAVEVAWPHLASSDRFLRHAARVAVESQPVGEWAERALSEERPRAKISALVALARAGGREYGGRALSSLTELDLSSLESEQKIGYLRALSLIFMRFGTPDRSILPDLTDSLLSLLPNSDERVNTEAVRLLVYLKDARVINVSLALIDRPYGSSANELNSLLVRNSRYGASVKKMLDNPPPVRNLEYAFMLRNLKEEWTLPQRRDYFEFINQAATHSGGASYTGYLTNIKNEALRSVNPDMRDALADITGEHLESEPPFEIIPPAGPGRNWSLNEAVIVVAEALDNRNFENGRNAFFAAGCASCHRFNGYGGNIGPDLETVGLRSSISGLVEDIIEPESLIPERFVMSRVRLLNGESMSGIIVEMGDSLIIYPIAPNEEPTVVGSEQVGSLETTGTSPMPAGLVNVLNSDELSDLIAYLRSGGNPESQIFK